MKLYKIPVRILFSGELWLPWQPKYLFYVILKKTSHRALMHVTSFCGFPRSVLKLIMPLALLVLSTVPVRLSIRNISCPLHISYTLFIMWAIMDSLCRVRPTVGRSVQRCWRLHSAHLGDLQFLKRCGNAVRTPHWCDMGFKYITMSEKYAVLVLWNITL